MPYVNKETIARARETDLLTYLQQMEPGELVHAGGNVYSLRSHDSFKISNGKWFWWSRGYGGNSALDYLIQVKGMRLPEAVEQISRINGTLTAPSPTVRRQPAASDGSNAFLLPQAHTDSRRVFAYLCSRGIDPEIINHCIKHGMLYEEAEHHNAVFVGHDHTGAAQYAAMRSTLSQSIFVQDVTGSKKENGFCLHAKQPAGTVYVFESAIDALSGATLCKMKRNDWRQRHFLSLGGVAAPPKNHSPVFPRALKQFLIDYEPDQIVLCLDNDGTGRAAAASISERLARAEYKVSDCPPPRGKDYNELLQMKKGISKAMKMRGKERAR